MPKQIIIAEQYRLAAVFWEDQIQELVVATGNHQVGDIYLGIVENVLPGIDAAFVNIGDPERNGFIHVTDLGPLRLKRRSGAITELLAPQQKVLVQVMKEPTGNKGPRLTGNISLPGRYLVMMPYGRGVNLSRRIRSENERNRLRALAILIKPSGMGLLVRTEAEDKAEEAIIEDLETLQRQWEAIQEEANAARPPALLNRDNDFIQRVLRDMYTSEVNRIVVDSNAGLKRVKLHLLSWSGGRSPEGVLIDHHQDRMSILEYFRVNAAIREALKPRVDLPSGGYIIIEPTEALTVIDVNSGSFTRSATARETVLWTNCEAATEIARQLRLRNIAGVIIVDFIDMDSRRDQLQVLEHFNKALRTDKARPQIAQLSELGLVELTRKRQGQNIYELFGQVCPTCNGLGHVVRLPGEASPYQTSGVVEPPVRLDSRESRPSDIPGQFDLPPLKDPEAIELLHHPSYQEQGLTNNIRRRRRRIDENLTKEEGIGRMPSLPIPVSQRLSESGEADLPRFGRRLPKELSFPTGAGEVGRGSLSDEGESPAKPQLIKSNKEIKPPEIISVEMTPEEQDVYALMGISPLIRLERDLKEFRSVIVSVVLPGEADKTENINPAPVAFSTEPKTISLVSKKKETIPLQKEETIPLQEEETIPLQEEETSEKLLLTTSVAAVETKTPTDSASNTESPISPPLIRRRRRRSSAMETENRDEV
ncbi:MAG: Rne/Rng family ribonuclease [Symploca sp. SIO2E6]|nr:Rne/Rng family ribonuclease [Symploca sp. SIO2E6]